MTKEQARREIDSLDFYLQNHTDDYGEESHTAMMMAKDALSSSENPNKWIPVSERLPEKNMACLVAVGKLNLTQMAMYSDLMGTIDHRIFYQGNYGDDTFENITQYVKAWMPLPESYKEKKDECSANME